MPNDKNESYASDILRRLHESVQMPEQDVLAIPLKDVQAELARRGIDAAVVLAQVKQYVARSRAELELTSARAERDRMLQAMRDLQAKLGAFSSQVREQALTVLRRLCASDSDTAAAYFSKFENASEADLQSLLDDLSHLDESDNEKPGGDA